MNWFCHFVNFEFTLGGCKFKIYTILQIERSTSIRNTLRNSIECSNFLLTVDICEDDKTVGVAIIKSKGHYIGRSYPQIGKDVYFCSPECNFYILYVFLVLQLPRSNKIFYKHSRCTNS